MIYIVSILVVFALGFGAGRTKHFDKLIASVKAFFGKKA